MAYAERHTQTVTTATGGAATVYTPVITGRIAAIVYTKATAAVAYASTVDFTITSDTSNQTLWSELNVNASKTARPVGVATLPSGASSTITESPIYVAQERVKIVLAAGGNTKQGTFTVIVA
jgi:hypothetical protein